MCGFNVLKDYTLMILNANNFVPLWCILPFLWIKRILALCFILCYLYFKCASPYWCNRDSFYHVVCQYVAHVTKTSQRLSKILSPLLHAFVFEYFLFIMHRIDYLFWYLQIHPTYCFFFFFVPCQHCFVLIDEKYTLYNITFKRYTVWNNVPY